LTGLSGPTSCTAGIFAITYDELASLPVVHLSYNPGDNSVTATWDDGGRSYRLMKRESLTDEDWMPVGVAPAYITTPPWNSGPLDGARTMFLRLELAEP
jgi:hypothetical protein